MKINNFEKIIKEGIPIKKNDKEININIKRIEIPKIQRDYAQGRESAKEIREKFIDAIFESLSGNKPMEMDFIYGVVNEKSGIFTPLDGQQRLTTLFLLYWYIGTRELQEGKRDDLYDLLINFTYETRITSRRFCENLCKKSSKTAISFEDVPSKKIADLPWFYMSYKRDPTIKSMLNMLDAIHEKYIRKDEDAKLFPNLGNLQFYILPLNNFNLTDELYVKMNARGKQLTDFENFKADLIKWMKDEKNQNKKDFNEEVELDGRKMSYYFRISLKVDTKWTEFFWQITKKYDITEKYKEGDKIGKLVHPEGYLVDPLFIRLFYRYFLQDFILNSNIDNKGIEKTHAYKELYYNEGKYQNFQEFEKILNINVIKDFETFLDRLKCNWNEIENSITPSWNVKDGNKWSFLNETITQKDRVVLLAISLFLLKNPDFNKTLFKQWMRFVWNVVENTDINDAATMIGVMNLIKELSLNAYRIYDFLANREDIKSSSSKDAIEEERKKASFINKNINWEEEFVKAEEHPFFKGAVGFLISDDAGVDDNMTIEQFRHRKERAFEVFYKKGVNEEFRRNGRIFLRALISRYTDEKIVNKYFTDKDENGYLKNMLVSNKVVRKAAREWFSLKDKEELKNTLNQSVEEDSKIQKWNNNNEQEKPRLRRAHEALYKFPELQDWMQEEGAIRFDNRYGHLYISKPSGSERRWIMLETCRNEVIEHLLKNGFGFKMGTERRIKEKIPFFWGFDIEVFGSVNAKEYKITFYRSNKIEIMKKNENEWEGIKTDDYDDYLEKDIDPKSLFDFLSKL